MQAESDLTLGQGRLKERSPIAVIDIGSNSVRQVVYEGLTRAPSVLFNEKVLAGLGKGMVSSGKLDEVAVERALNAIKRFIALGKQLKVSRTHVIATAAARDAKNGPQFIAQVEALTGLKVEVLTGAKEAKYSALGVKSGFYKPNGIVGDMGGGSLELVGINGKIKKGITLPLGGIRLAEAAEGSQQTAIKIANKALKQAEVVWPSKQKTFYAIGGTWRSLGHLHIAHTNYTLSSVHEYQISANEMIEFCEYIIQKGVADISGINAVSKNRRDLLPMGAIVMHATLKSLKADTVAFSSLGVREGVMHALLSKSEQKKDALLDAALDLSTLRSRTPKHCLELSDWTTNAFKVIGIKESAEEKRFRTASCYLTDIAWRAHSDFRADQYLGIINSAGFVSISHEGHAYLALSNYHRHAGLGSKVMPPKIGVLASDEIHKKARILAALFRVLFLFSASTPNILPHIKIKKSKASGIKISVPKYLSSIMGERPQERVNQLGKELDSPIELVVQG